MHPAITPKGDMTDDRPIHYLYRRRALFLICHKLGWTDITQSTPANTMRTRMLESGIDPQNFNIPQLNKEYMDALRAADGAHTHVTEEITFPKMPEPTPETLEKTPTTPDFSALKIYEIKKLCKSYGIVTKRTDKKPVLVAKLMGYVENLRHGENTT